MSMTSQGVQHASPWPYHANPPGEYASSGTSGIRSTLMHSDMAGGDLAGVIQRPQYSYQQHERPTPPTLKDSQPLFPTGNQQHPVPQTPVQQHQQKPSIVASQKTHQQQQPSQPQSQIQPQQNRQQSLSSPPKHSQQQTQQHQAQHQPQSDSIDRESAVSQKIRRPELGPRKQSNEPVRRRTSRACDQCNHLRTKCDGKRPCSHCVETSLSCDYARLRKKRGKASRKELAEQAAVDGNKHLIKSAIEHSAIHAAGREVPLNSVHSIGHDMSYTGNFDNPSQNLPGHSQHANDARGMSVVTETQSDSPDTSHMGIPTDAAGSAAPAHQQLPGNALVGGLDQSYRAVDMDGFANHAYGPRHRLDSTHSSNGRINVMDLAHVYDVNMPGMHDQMGIDTFNFPMDSPSALLLDGGNVPPSPGSASIGGTSNGSAVASNSSLKYPVLRPLLPHTKSIIPQNLAYELVEHYFSSSSSAHPHPASPYLLGFVFSKRSFLRSSKPRECSPALLASMLWIAARTSNARALTSPPSRRGRICQKLLNLSISLLKPLIHGSVAGKAVSDSPAGLVINGSALGGDGVTVDHLTPEKVAAGTLDDVATYMHLAIVVSASEDKSASLRWWTAAWNLAKELKLGRELPPNVQSPDPAMDQQEEVLHDEEDRMDLDPTAMIYSEEEREERRRLWWVLYITDRHLALCYNRPLNLLERECEGLLRPMDERTWQTGSFNVSETTSSPGSVRRASRFEFIGPSIFGFFLPLMTILGEIVDLHQARQHPMLRCLPGDTQLWDGQIQHVITQQLEAYERSMQSYQAQNMPPQTSFNDGDPAARTTMTESQIHTKIAIAYSTHVMHVLHILATGKWDPISLLDDNDLWISSPSFVTAIGHAVSGAEAVTDILSYDPELSFMPFLYGVYLLQGSFLLLLIADKLQADASPNVVRACETIVRAHEACVVTLNTEYQRAFRKVMQSALAQVRGRVPEDAGEQQRRRRETLALYRWTGDGSGLAI